MSRRTFAIGDIHGQPDHLSTLLGRLPPLDAEDTVVCLGDYLDRGPRCKEVVRFLMSFSAQSPAKLVCLRGNHEDAWLRVLREGWDEFVLPPNNGCLATLRSFTGGTPPRPGEEARQDEMLALTTASFFPADVVSWMEALPFWYEDEHAIYVHAGLPREAGEFAHPARVTNPLALLWIRTQDFFRNYTGKRVVFGHTPTEFLPQELSSHTPDDHTDLFLGEHLAGLDTGSGMGGFLSAVELPGLRVYESR